MVFSLQMIITCGISGRPEDNYGKSAHGVCGEKIAWNIPGYKQEPNYY